eukprot:g20007.t1
MTTIRNAREDEVEVLAEIGFRAWEKAMAAIGEMADMRDSARAAFQNFAAASWLTITVVEQFGQQAGWAAREQLDELITDFWVDPPFRGQGLGRALLEGVEAGIVHQGLESARIETHAQNVEAIGFFERHGYRVNWLSVAYSPKIDRDVQSVGLIKQLVEPSGSGYGASTEFGKPANANVSLVDAAMPGMLPVINEECVRQAVRTGLGLKAQINKRSLFDRKNYFYPDLPQGYQISQYKDPVVGEGKIVISLGPDRQGQFEDIEIGIERLHLEQDAGKLMHDQHPTMSYVDLNRSGVALMEIVSKPDMRSSDEAKAYMTKLRSIVRYLGTCDGNMDEGSMRADVNVSVRRPGEAFGTRCEIKNVNSIRFIGQAIEYEARRQIEILEDGGTIDQETRLFDPNKGETRSMRSKEDAHDYRYFPDPDLLPLEFDDAFIEELRAGLTELPDDKKARFVRELGLSVYDASVLVSEKAIADYFEAVAEGRDGKTAANWVINDLLGALNRLGKSIEETPVSPRQLGGIIDLIKAETISGKIAKDVFEIVLAEGGDPAEIVEARGMKQVTDTGAIEKSVDEIIAANPDQVEKVKAKPTLAGWFVGQEDVAKIRSLLEETFHATYDGFYGAETVTRLVGAWHSAAAIRSRLQKKDGEFLVADDGRQIGGIGYAAAYPKMAKTVMLHQLYVQPAHQGEGVGRDIFAELETCFPDAEIMRVEVALPNKRAVSFYERLGFVELIAIFADDNVGGHGDTTDEAAFHDYLRAFHAIDASANEQLFVAETDGEIAGTFQILFNRTLTGRGSLSMIIEAVQTRSDLRGRGIGARMIAYAIEEAKRRECRLVQLTSNRMRTDAHRFYERLGFEPSHLGFKMRLK